MQDSVTICNDADEKKYTRLALFLLRFPPIVTMINYSSVSLKLNNNIRSSQE